MTITKYKAKMNSDSGTYYLTLTSLSGEAGAIRQIMTIENCPRCAILSLKLLSTKEV